MILCSHPDWKKTQILSLILSKSAGWGFSEFFLSISWAKVLTDFWMTFCCFSLLALFWISNGRASAIEKWIHREKIFYFKEYLANKFKKKFHYKKKRIKSTVDESNCWNYFFWNYFLLILEFELPYSKSLWARFFWTLSSHNK